MLLFATLYVNPDPMKLKTFSQNVVIGIMLGIEVFSQQLRIQPGLFSNSPIDIIAINFFFLFEKGVGEDGNSVLLPYVYEPACKYALGRYRQL